MCLQDLQLARGVLVESRELTAAAIETGALLPQNPQRVGFVVTGPSTGTLDLFLGEQNARRIVVTLSPSTGSLQRHISILDLGEVITEPWFYATSAAMDWTVWEYSLPVDPSNLVKLATKARW